MLSSTMIVISSQPNKLVYARWLRRMTALPKHKTLYKNHAWRLFPTDDPSSMSPMTTPNTVAIIGFSLYIKGVSHLVSSVFT